MPLDGEWYRWFVGQREENPGRSSRWNGLREALWHLLELVAADDERHEIDMEAPEVRDEIHPKLADEAKTAQFLASKGEVLTPVAMELFLAAVLQEFLAASGLLKRRAPGDYSPDQYLQTLPEYRKATSPVAPRSGKTAMQLFEGYIPAAGLDAGTVGRWRVVFTSLDAHLAGRDIDALSDDEAQRWVTALVTKKPSAFTVMNIWVTARKGRVPWAAKQRRLREILSLVVLCQFKEGTAS